MAIYRKTLLLITILAIVSLLVFFIVSRNLASGAFDVAPGYRVLQVELVKGDRKSEFQFTVPNDPNVQNVDCITPTPTNVLWILYQAPILSNSDYRLRWVFTNRLGQRVAPGSLPMVTGGGHYNRSGEFFVAYPATIPDVSTISNGVICFEMEGTGEPLFKIKIP